ncbi:hypothetical protein MTR_3g118230 [Medicago truncatula]|uniref:Uncharacterized protein n=1 Tax=Medicago truncatula TaxID=3880 RepID=G7J8L8_MEDTR|nr:hypothetical protein MTR_3g118230 [Medicago truncatula]
MANTGNNTSAAQKNQRTYAFLKKQIISCLRLCLRVLRGRKGKPKERKERKGREGRKEGKPSPCLRVKTPTRKGDE